MRAIWMTIMIPLAACAATDAGSSPTAALVAPPDAPDGGRCDAAAVAGFVGKTATTALGAQMLKASGARTLRWGGPDSMMTMDYRQDRLTVSHDAKRVITGARCT